MSPSPSKIYLFTYNSLQTVGWLVSVIRIVVGVASTQSLASAYESAGTLICLLQSVAFMEVLHGALGLVLSGWLFPLMQWGGRTHFLLAIVRQIPEVQELPSVFITFVAWGLSDVIRYLQYALNCTGSCPPWITYLREVNPDETGSQIEALMHAPFSSACWDRHLRRCQNLTWSKLQTVYRYTTFIVLYPIGMAAGEMWIMIQALPYVKKSNLYANLFNSLPFSYYDFLMVLLLTYPLLWLKLYLHLFKQRRSKLGKSHEQKKMKKKTK